MGTFLVLRFLYAIVVVLLATVIVFGLSRMAGDPRYLYLSEYSHVSEDTWDEWGRIMGLDKPVVLQYLIWLGKALRADWGASIVNGRPAFDAVIERVPATLQLTAGGFVFAVLFGIPLGVLSAANRGSVWDYVARVFAILGQSLPSFWIAIVFILVFAVILGWLPTSGRGGVTHYIMPSVTIGWFAAAGFLRLTRSSLLDVLDSDFVMLARAKGVSKRRVLWKHAFRNAAIAPLTYGGLILAAFATGSIVIETVFAWPGLGLLAITAVYNNDFTILTGSVLVFASMYAFMALLVDVTYAYVDPRIRYR